MKYQIMYDKGARLRVRSGKDAFTKEEGYGLAASLREHCFIKEVSTSHRNGSILIVYDDVKNKDRVLSILNNIRRSDLVKGEPTSKEELRELTNRFLLK